MLLNQRCIQIIFLICWNHWVNIAEVRLRVLRCRICWYDCKSLLSELFGMCFSYPRLLLTSMLYVGRHESRRLWVTKPKRDISMQSHWLLVSAILRGWDPPNHSNYELETGWRGSEVISTSQIHLFFVLPYTISFRIILPILFRQLILSLIILSILYIFH